MAPSSGRNVTIERIGTSAIVIAARSSRYEPAITISPTAMPRA